MNDILGVIGVGLFFLFLVAVILYGRKKDKGPG